MQKLPVIVATMFSLGAMVGMSDDPPVPSTTSPADEPQDVVVQVAPELDDSDGASELRTAYLLLRKLRGERLEEKPKALADRAVVLYRDGIKAIELGDVAAARKLGAASLKLAEAIELSLQARADDSDDPELPAPPVVRLRVEAKPRVITGEFGPVVVELPPVLDGAPATPPGTSQTSETQKTAITGRVHVVRPGGAHVVRSGDVHEGEDVIVLKGSELQGQLKAGGRFVIQSPDSKKHEFSVELPRETIRKRILDVRPLGARAVVVQAGSDDDAKTAREELHAAYQQIRKARAAHKDDSARIYLDSARDLYNAARREAEAGRNARALELTRAALALVRVPALLAEMTTKGEAKAEKREAKTEKKEVKKEQKEQKRIELRLVPKAEKKVEGKEEKRVEVRVQTDEGAKEGETPKRRIRIETRKRTVGPDGKPKEEVHVEEREIGPDGKVIVTPKDDEAAVKTDDAGKLVGVGLMLTLDDDAIVVQDLVPNGPAAKEGSIKKGDRLVGVEGDEGKVTEFAGKELADVVKLVRGEAGTKVRLVVQPEGSDERKTVELRREKIVLPTSEEEEGGKKEGETHTFRFVIPGGEKGDLGEMKFDVEPFIRRFGDARSFRFGTGPLRLEIKPDIEIERKGDKAPADRDKKPEPKGDPSLPPPIEA